MSNGVTIAVVAGGAVIIAAAIIYVSAQKTSQAASSAVAGTSNLNTLAGQVSGLLNQIGVKAPSNSEATL